jgi:hypothetical protein
MRRGGGFDDQGRPYRLDMGGPCSPNQWGRIRRECERLGVEGDAGRLALVGALAGRPVASTRDLDAGTAGAVVRALAGCSSAGAAWALADAPKRARQRARMRARLVSQLTERMAADGRS